MISHHCVSHWDQVFEFPNPDVPGARHGPPQNQGFHFSGSSGFVYEVWHWTYAVAQTLCDSVAQILLAHPMNTAICPASTPMTKTHAVQAAAVHSAVINGWNEMDDMPLSDTLALAKTLDRIRWQVGDYVADAAEPSVFHPLGVCVLKRCSQMTVT